MTDYSGTKIIAFVGLPGAGKSSAVEYLIHKGYPKVYFGGVVLQAVKDAGLEVTPENEKLVREKLRVDEGKDVIVNRIIGQIEALIAAGQHRIIADGLYSWTEYKVLKHSFSTELTVIAVVAPKRLRHRRLAERPIRPLSQQEAIARDYAEIENLEKGGPIAIADYYVHNDRDLAWLHQKIDAILHDIEF